MLYILGVNIPNNKSVKIALTHIYGIGKNRANIICNKQHIMEATRVNNLSDTQINNLTREIKTYIIETDLKKLRRENIKRFIDIGSYKGFRHSSSLPVRGQRTHTNAKTQRYLSRKLVKKTIDTNSNKIGIKK